MVFFQKAGTGELAATTRPTFAQKIAAFFSRHRNGQDAPVPETTTRLVITPRGLEQQEVPVAILAQEQEASARKPSRPRLQLPEEAAQAKPGLPRTSPAVIENLQLRLLTAYSEQKFVDENSMSEVQKVLGPFLDSTSLAGQFAVLNVLIPKFSEPTVQEFLQEQRLLIMLKFDAAVQNPLELLDRKGLEHLLSVLDAALADNAVMAKLEQSMPQSTGFFSKSTKQKLLTVRTSVKGLLFATDEDRLYERLKSTVTLHTDLPPENSPLTQTGLLAALDYTPPEKLDRPVPEAPELDIPLHKLPQPHAADAPDTGPGGLQAALKGQPAVPKGAAEPIAQETDPSITSTAYREPVLPPSQQGGLWGALTGYSPDYSLESQEPLPLPPEASETTVRRTPELGDLSLSEILQGTPKLAPEAAPPSLQEIIRQASKLPPEPPAR
jgi:hypothetical protein